MNEGQRGFKVSMFYYYLISSQIDCGVMRAKKCLDSVRKVAETRGAELKYNTRVNEVSPDSRLFS